jgi:hypothetical protein
MNKHLKNIFIITSIIAFGALLRFYLAANAYPTLVFDTKTYADYAQEFLRGSTPIDPRNKNMGYPLFLAILFWMRGGVDIEFAKVVQIFLDLFAGLFVFIAAGKIFAPKFARIALFLYMLNPFTSSYVGLLLPEALSCFLVGVLLFVTTSTGFRRKTFLWFLFGFLLGLLLFARFSLLTFAVGSIGILSILSFKREVFWKFIVIAFAGFLLASSYSLIINYKTYGKASFSPTYTTIGGQMYLTMFIADRYPEAEFWGVNPEETRVYEEYRKTPLSELSNWNKRYISLFFSKLTREPLTFLSHYVKNIFWLWDKDHLFTYQDPWYPKDRYILRVVNLILLGLSVLGLFSYVRKDVKTLSEPFVIVTLVLAVVMSVQFPLVSNENRHTIAFYPLLYFWAAYGIGKLQFL